MCYEPLSSILSRSLGRSSYVRILLSVVRLREARYGYVIALVSLAGLKAPHLTSIRNQSHPPNDFAIGP
jgi:hypothetical protein